MRRLLASVLWLGASAAQAQAGPPAPAAPPPGLRTLPRDPPAQIAAARAEGDALLKAAHAEDLFVNETDGGAIVLRHKASGFRCVLEQGHVRNRVAVCKSLTAGDDVGCWT